MNDPTDLKTQWKTTGKILISPIVIITLICTVGAIYLATVFSSNPNAVTIFSGVAAISSGVLGGIAWDQYREITSNSIFLKKGKSAVRNLVLIDDQINRLRTHLLDMEHRKTPLAVDNIDHHLLTTEKNVISAIEDWVDMVPDLRKQAELAQSLSQESEYYKEILNEKVALEEKLSKKGANEKDLESQIEQKDKELNRIHSEISRLKSQQIGTGVPRLTNSITGLSPLASALITSGYNHLQTCESCGKKYERNPSITTSLITSNRCDDCSSLNKINSTGRLI